VVTCCGWYALPDVDLSLGSLLILAFAGAVVWPLNPEAAVVLHVSAGGLHPVAVAAVAAVGQLGAHLLLWIGGTWLRRNWRWFDRQCTRTQARFGPRLTSGTVPVMVSAGVLGFPPAWAAATLGPGLGLSPRLVLPLLFLGRIVRFGALALMAAGLLGSRIP
jgi:membrane protein YqaA with SNARE-associated domain